MVEAAEEGGSGSEAAEEDLDGEEEDMVVWVDNRCSQEEAEEELA